VLIRIPKPVSDDESIERVPNSDGDSEAIFVNPLSGVVIVVDQGFGCRGRARKRRRQSPLWRSLLSRWLTAARAASSMIIHLEPEARLQPVSSPVNRGRHQAGRAGQSLSKIEWRIIADDCRLCDRFETSNKRGRRTTRVGAVSFDLSAMRKRAGASAARDKPVHLPELEAGQIWVIEISPTDELSTLHRAIMTPAMS
jgi:hypothetical protein